jgi:hydrogenase maturation protease
LREDGTEAKLLVLGLGNDLLSDDGFGPAVAEACRDGLNGRPEVRVETAAVGGFHLLDLLQGHERALVVDVVRTGAHPPGTLLEWPMARSAASGGRMRSHALDLATALAFGRAVGFSLPASVSLLVAEADDLVTLREGLTPPLRDAVPEAVRCVRRWVERGTTGALAPGGQDERAGVVS